MSFTSSAIVAQATTLNRTFPLTVSASSTTSAFVRAAGSWVTDGVKVGMVVSSDDAENVASYTVTAVSATDMTVTPAITADASAESIIFTFLVPIGEITNFDGPGGTNSEIDVTSMDSTSREFRNGLRDSGEVTLEMNFVPGNVGQVDLRTQQAETNTPGSYVMILSDATEISFSAFVREFSISGAVDDKVSASVTLRVTGDVTWSDMA
jgi:predicted secreted protein